MKEELKKKNNVAKRLHYFNSTSEKMEAPSHNHSTAYYFETILSFHLLLKLNYRNVMQLLKINKILIIAQGVPLNRMTKTSLGLEIITGQKTFYSFLSVSPNVSANQKKSRINSFSSQPRAFSNMWLQSMKHRIAPTLSKKGSFQYSNLQSDSALIYCSLRNEVMYNFLDKMVDFRFISSSGMPKNYQIQGANIIEIRLKNRQIRLLPEIQNHFEFFESIQSIQIKIITSATRKEETCLFWTSFQQKDI